MPESNHDQLLPVEWDLPLLDSAAPAAPGARAQLLAVEWELPALDFFPPGRTDAEIGELVAELGIELGVKRPACSPVAEPRLLVMVDRLSRNLHIGRKRAGRAPPPIPGWAGSSNRSAPPFFGSGEITVSLSGRCR